MSSDESEVDEAGVDRMGVLIIEHMMLGALPRSDAVQALLASGGDVVAACARFVPREDPHFEERLAAAVEAASAEADVDEALDMASPLGAAASMQKKSREHNPSAGGDIDGVDAFDARRATRRASDLLGRASLGDDEDEEVVDESQIYARWSGKGKLDPNTEEPWTEEALGAYFDKFTDVPSGPVFEAGGGNRHVASLLRKLKTKLDRSKKQRDGRATAQARRAAGGIYSARDAQFPTDDKGVITKIERGDWLSGGGYPETHAREMKRYNAWKNESEATVAVRTERNETVRYVAGEMPTNPYKLHEPTGGVQVHPFNRPEKWDFIVENWDTTKPGNAAASKLLLDEHCKGVSDTLRGRTLLGYGWQTTERSTGFANPHPTVARIATCGSVKTNRIREVLERDLYAFEMEGGVWRDRSSEVSVRWDGDTPTYHPNVAVYLACEALELQILRRDPDTHKLDQNGERTVALQRLADLQYEREQAAKDARDRGGRRMLIPGTQLLLFLDYYALMNCQVDWGRRGLEACVQGAEGTMNILAGLKPRQRMLAMRGRGHVSMADRLGLGTDEVKAVNSELGRRGREFSDVARALAARGESLHFSLRFWPFVGPELDARCFEITDVAALINDNQYTGHGEWTSTALNSQLYQALQYGSRLVTGIDGLVLADEVPSHCFNEFVDRRKQERERKREDNDYDWTIWFGLDYRLTYTHPVTKKRIVICPQAVRDELRARGDGASARSDA